MKKFTLLLVLLLAVVGVKATSEDIVAYSTTIDGTSTKQSPTIEASNFTQLRGGDYFNVTISNATAAKLSMKDASVWDTFVNEATPSNGVYKTAVITEKQAADIKTSGLYLEIEGAKITQISYRHTGAISIWSGSENLGEWGSFDIDNLKSFQGATTNNKIRFKGTLGEGQQQLNSFQYLTGAGWAATDITTGAIDFSGTKDEAFTCYVDVTSSLVDAIPLTGDDTRIRAYRANGKGITITNIDLCTPLNITDTYVPACDEGTYSVVNLTRSLIAGYNTLCLPFAATKAALGLEEDDVIYELGEGSSASSIKLSTVTSIEANKPYLVYCAAARTLTSSFDNLEVSSSDASSTTKGDWTMYGNYTPSLSMNGKYIVYGDKIQLCGSGPYVNGLRAYFEYKGSEARESVTFDFGGETTGVNDVRSKMSEARSEYFNLAGQRIAQPTKGLYIVNGKKVVIK